MSNVTEIAQASFAEEVLKSPLPVLVDFYATWCAPCKAVAPVLDLLAGEYNGRAKVVKVNVEDAADLATQYRITGVPTLMIFKNGQVADTMVGAPPAKVLRGKLESAVSGQ